MALLINIILDQTRLDYIVPIEMSKNPNSRAKQSRTFHQNQYEFKLIPMPHIRSTSDIKKVSVSFEPFHTEGGTYESILPTFNLDRKHWTKSFVLGFRREYYMSNPLKEKQKFAQKFREKTYYDNLSSHTQIQSHIAPRPKSHYCEVCQVSFQNYYHHTKKKSHIKNENENVASQYINELIEKYKNNRLKSSRPFLQLHKKNNEQAKLQEKNYKGKRIKKVRASPKRQTKNENYE